jgi:hypothetical protein
MLGSPTAPRPYAARIRLLATKIWNHMAPRYAALALLFSAFLDCVPAQARAEPQDLRPPLALLPEQSVVVLEVQRPSQLLQALAAHPLGMPLTQAPEEMPWRQGLLEVESFLGQSLASTLSVLADRGAALGLLPDDPDWRTGLVLWASDAQASAELLARIFDQLEARFGAPGMLDKPRELIAGAPVWSLGEDLWIGQAGGRLMASQTRALLAEMLTRASQPDALGLLGHPAVTAAREVPAPPLGVWLWTDMQRLRAAKSEIQWAELDALVRRPEGLLGIGAGLALLPQAEHWSASLALDGNRLLLDLLGRGLKAAPSGLVPTQPAGMRTFLGHPGNVAEALLYRDFALLVDERARLLEPSALARFSAKLTELEVFFGGLRLGEDVLSKLSPWWQAVVREVPFPAGGTPGMPLPGAALFIAMPNDPRLHHALDAAFQSLVSIANVEGAQQGRPPLRLAVKLHGNQPYSMASPMPLAEGEVGDLRYNLVPALAMTEAGLLLATHEGLLLDLLDELEPAEGQAPEPAESLHIHGAALAQWARGQLPRLKLLAELSGQRAYLDAWIQWLADSQLRANLRFPSDRLRLSVQLEHAAAR